MRKDYRKSGAEIEMSDKYGKELKRVKAPKSETKLEKGLSAKTGSRANSIDWYANNPELVRDSASFPTNDPLGDRVDLSIHSRSIPGVCILNYVPIVGSIGSQDVGSAAINIAMKYYYAQIRKANSGSRNYEATDLLQYVLAVAGAHELAAQLRRAYALTLQAQRTNRYFQRRMLEALGFNADDLIRHIADLRLFINRFTIMINSFGIPKELSFLKRRIWMCSNIFCDAPIRKAQLYMYNPVGLTFYDWENAQIKHTEFRSANDDIMYGSYELTHENGDDIYITFESIVLACNKVLNSLNSVEDVGLISGDIIKALGDDGLFTSPLLDVDYRVEPVYIPEVITQIHNSTIMYDSKTLPGDETVTSILSRCTIKQDGVNLVYNSALGNLALPQWWYVNDTEAPIDYTKLLLDFPVEPVSPEMIMVATRNMYGFKVVEHVDDSPTTLVDVLGAGSEIILFASLYNMTQDRTFSTFLVNSNLTTVASLIEFTTPFSYLPRAYSFVKQVYDDEDHYRYMFNDFELGQIDNYTVISTDTLKKMSETAIISEFSVGAQLG